MAGRATQWALRLAAAALLIGFFVVSALIVEAPRPTVSEREGTLPEAVLTSSGSYSPATPSFTVDAVVRNDGSVAVTETIVEDFGMRSRHGIERIIPEIEQVAGGGTRLFAVTDLVVSTSPDTPGDVKLSTDTRQLTVRIGDPASTIRGVHAYRLDYVVPAAVTATPGALTLLWDAISSWDEAIGSLTFRVDGPAPITRAACLTGAAGAGTRCARTAVVGRRVVMEQYNLAPGTALTADIRWDRQGFGPVAAPAVPEGWRERTGGTGGLAVVVGALILLAVAQLVIIRRARRDNAVTPATLDATFALQFGGPQAFDPTSGAAYSLPLAAPGSLDAVGDRPVVEFVPPQGLRPVELAELLERGSASTCLAGTVVDLAARGYLDIVPDPAGDEEWTLVWTGAQNPDLLRDYEHDVIHSLLGGAPSVALSDRASVMPDLAARVRSSVRRELRRLGLMLRRTRTMSGAHLACGTLTALALVGAAVGLRLVGHSAWGLVVLAQAGIVLGASSVFVPVASFTPLGAAMAWRAAGFQRLFDESENYHAELAANAGIMRDYMGYAVTLGSVDRWTSAFPAEVRNAAGPLVSPYALLAFHHAVVAAATPARSSGGFSGGSSFGGGGAGGGGGGGGGGSW